MSEAITNLDMNFSNGGAGHTATVRSVLNAKNPDGSDSLGFVAGELGEKGSFSKEEFSTAMKEFMLTDIVTNKDPSKTVITRKYTDITSLKIDSYVVLVRGINAPPVGTQYPPVDSPQDEGVVPYFGEVSDSPAFSFGAAIPTKHKNTLIAGKIYNTEATSQFNGIKMTLTYQSQKLVPNLSLNHQFVDPAYLASPDLAQYNLKFGYTFQEFKQLCALAGVTVKWPQVKDSSKILFDTSGPLRGVISSIASYFGFYHFINPKDGVIEFMDSKLAAQLSIENPTSNPDENVVNASFSETLLNQTIVNTYVGTTETPEETQTTSSNDPDNVKMIPSFFKRVKIEDVAMDATGMRQKDLGAFFELYNMEGLKDSIFDVWVYLLQILNERLLIKANRARRQPPCVPNRAQNWREWLPNQRLDEWLGGELNLGKFLKDRKPASCDGSLDEWLWYESGGNLAIYTNIYDAVNADLEKDGRLKGDWPRMDNLKNGSVWFRLTEETAFAKGFRNLSWPHNFWLKPFLEAFFGLAGGVYMSNAYDAFKADRMQFANTGPLNVCGPYAWNDTVDQVKELPALGQFFDALTDIGFAAMPTLDELAIATDGQVKRAQRNNAKYFIAFRNPTKVTIPDHLKGRMDRCDFGPLEDMDY